uniref:Abnormal spindle-like microcephaly-associated protein ASH domain-containing protein n=1 Tax=Bracon brevicornis TaxID=1563983 RepID=A0A6V7LFD5_9HYME
MSNSSSLGILNDISSRSIIDESDGASFNFNRFEIQRQLARELLQKLSDQGDRILLDINKENNVNSQNLTDNDTTPTLTDIISPQQTLQKDNTTLLSTSQQKDSINSVVFEPNEITGRSSEKTKSPNSSTRLIPDGFSFNSTAAELMAKFSSEEFLSGSQMNGQFEADEFSWQQNYNPLPPSAEKERLDFSCFSGIMGDVDITIDSGRKVSVGEFFSRKCEALGDLSTDKSPNRPNFGYEIKSPKRAKPVPLLNASAITDTLRTSVAKISDKFSATSCIDDTRDDDEPLISLSGIAKALDMDDNPRRLVDHLLKMKKEKQQRDSKPFENGNTTAGTYTIQSARTSIPLSGDTPHKTPGKLSLDSRILNSTQWSVPRSSVPAALFEFSNVTSTKFQEISEPELSAANGASNSTGSFKSPYQSPLKQQKPETLASPFNKDLLKDLISKQAPLSPGNHEVNKIQEEINGVKEEVPSLSESNSEGKFNNTTLKNAPERLTIGKNAEGFYQCIVGVPRDAKIEMKSDSNHWLACKVQLMQIQGDKDNIQLTLPSRPVLIEPNQIISSEIGVKVLRNTGPILAALTINCNDMTTRESFTKHHMICFMPVEANVNVIYPEGHINQLNFESADNLSIVLQNKCDTDVPLEFEIVDNNLAMFIFQIQEPKRYSSQTHESHQSKEQSSNCVTLKANGKINVEIKLNKRNSLPIDNSAKFVIYLSTDSDKSVIQNIPLVIEEVRDQSGGNSSNEEQRDASTYSRCDTPQSQQLFASLPTSPNSVSSVATSTNNYGRASPRSLTSGLTVAGDSIPVQTTHSSISWATVKVGKYEIQEFTIRNSSNNKIKLQATITDNDRSFQFLKDRESSTTIIVGLQKKESRTLSVVYNPNRTGPSAGRITFIHYENVIKNPGMLNDGGNSRPSKFISLFGYGGYARVKMNQALQIGGAQMWLSLGKVNASGTLSSCVQLENSGDLPAYAKLTLTPKAVYPAVEKSWNVEPTEIILGPKQSQSIKIQFTPRKEDIALLKGDAADMGTLVITHGDEPTRWRIRRLYRKLLETKQIDEKQSHLFAHVVNPICKIFPGEMPIEKLSNIRDAVQDLGILCRNVNRQVVTLMMDSNSDETMSILTDDGDESHMFQSLCSDTSVLSVGNEDSYMPSESFLERSLARARIVCSDEEFNVTPTSITLNPPNEATVMISSGSSTAQPFETKITNSDILTVVPAGGMIPAKRDVLIKIQCKKNINRVFNEILHIFTMNEEKVVKIRVVPKRR